jgi:hypothetical protein
MSACLHKNANMRTSLDFPDSLFRHLKARAALEGSTLRDLVLNLVEKGLNSNTPAPPVDVLSMVTQPLPSLSLGAPLALLGAQLSNASLSALLDEEA